MHLSEVFTRKLALMPFELSNPVWVEDDDVDLDYHVRRVTLPRPGTMRQLEQYVGRLHSTLMDRSRPLWEFFVIDGLQGGGMAMYSKVHHAGIDGQAGAAFAQAIMDLTPHPEPIKAPRQIARRKRYQLGVAELAGAAFTNTLQQYVKLVKTLARHGARGEEPHRPAADERGQQGSGRCRRTSTCSARARRSTWRSPTSVPTPCARSRWPRSSRPARSSASASTTW